MPGSHSKQFPPSGSARWVTCTGSPALIASMPAEQQDKASPDSIRGTACHEVLAACVEGGHDPAIHVGDNILTSDGNYLITEEDAGNIRQSLTYIHSRIEALGGADVVEVCVERAVTPGAHLFTKDGEPIHEPDCWGTADIILYAPNGVVEVIDFKNGVRYVSEKDNSQLLLYAIGARGRQLDWESSVKTINMGITQPRVVVRNPTAEPHRMATITSAELTEHAKRFGEAVIEINRGEGVRRPSEQACEWCPAKAICPEHAQWVLEAATGGAEGEGAVAKLDTDLLDAFSRGANEMSAEQRGKVLGLKAMILSWVSAVEAYALKEAMQGRHTPGFKLVAGRKAYGWSLEPDDVVAKLTKLGRIGDDGKVSGKLKKADVTDVTPISVAQARKRIRPMVTPRTWETIEGLIVEKGGKPTLAPETDSRPALNVQTSEQIFGIGAPADATPAAAPEGELPDFLR